MHPIPPNSRQQGRYFAIAQVGLEMVVPIGVGWFLDDWLGWFPWATIGGAVLGLIGGMVHLVTLQNQSDAEDPGPEP